MKLKRKINIIISIFVLCLSIFVLVGCEASNETIEDSTVSANIVNQVVMSDKNITIDVTLENTSLNTSLNKDELVLDKAFRNLNVVSVSRKDDSTLSISTNGRISDDYIEGRIIIPSSYTTSGEIINAVTEVSVTDIDDKSFGIDVDYEYYGKLGGKAIVSYGIGKIPYVGETAANALGPILSDVFGLERDATLNSLRDQLKLISAQLNDISSQIDESTQEIMNRMFINSTFDYFDEKMNEIYTMTVSIYNNISEIYFLDEIVKGQDVDAKSLEDYQTFKTAELLDFDSRDLADFVNMVKSMIKYLDGTQTSMALKNKKGILENAFLSACDGAVLGGEAALRVGPYLNEVCGVLSQALKGMIIVLESKLYVSYMYDEIKAYAVEMDNLPLLRLMDDDAEKVYLDPTNFVSWLNLVSEETDASLIKLHNKYFDKKDSVVSQYNNLVNKHWFGYVRDYNLSDSNIEVEFSDFSRTIASVKPTEIGLDVGLTKAKTENNITMVQGKIGSEIHVSVSQDEIEKIIEHIINNENNVFLSYEPQKGIINFDDYLLDMLAAYGFEIDVVDSKNAYFISNSKGTFNKVSITDNSGHTIGYNYHSNLQVYGYNVNDVHTYNINTGLAYNDISWSKVEYYDYYSQFLSGDATLDYMNDCVFYYFVPAEIEIANKSDLFSFLDSIGKGNTYEGKTINLINDIDLEGESYAHMWDGKTNKEFKGTFEGNKHTIKNLSYATTNGNSGLFCVLGEGAQVNNLIIENFNIKATGSQSGYGALAGAINGYVRLNNVKVVGGSIDGTNGVGGLIGIIRNGSTIISYCSNSATITASGAYAGGIVGSSDNKKSQNINNCINTGNVTATSSKAAAGIIAYLANDSADQQHTIQYNTNKGNVNAGSGIASGIVGHLDTDNQNHDISNNSNSGIIKTNNNDAGGIIGYSEGGGIYLKNNNSGEVFGKNAGGILGANENDTIDFTGCNNTGTITGTVNAAGIVAYAGNNSSDSRYFFYKCTNEGTIIGGNHAGGIVAHLDTDNPLHAFNMNINSGNVTSNIDAGGIVGYSEGGGTYNGNENSGNITGRNAGGIIGANEDDTIKFISCKNSGNVNGSYNAGGIAGVLGDDSDDDLYTATECINSGNVNGTEHAGGIVGHLDTDSTSHSFTNCKNTGNVTASIDAGGIIGYSEGGGDFTHNTNSGKISGKNVGGIMGHNEDDHIDYSYGINNGAIDGGYYAGGILGYTGSRSNDKSFIFERCENNGEIYCEGGYAGGIAAYISSDNHNHAFTYCKNFASITGSNITAGICAVMEGGATFSGCINSGDIKSKLSKAAGICGYIDDDDCTFGACFNYGLVTASSIAAGILADDGGEGDCDNTVKIYSCENTGNITSTHGYAGGIVGLSTDDCDLYFEKCSNTAIIDGKVYVGGMIGMSYSDNKFVECSNSGKIISTECAGGLVGRISKSKSTFENCTNTGEIAGWKNYSGQYCGYDEGSKKSY